MVCRCRPSAPVAHHDPHRSAKLGGRREVWSSVRLPRGLEQEILRVEARNKLLVELRREGLLG